MNPFKVVKDKVMEYISKKKDEKAQDNKLSSWQDKFEKAKNNYDIAIFDEREMLYHGTHEVDWNVNSSEAPNKKANNVVNILYEFIESQIDTQIPQPSVRAKRPNNDYLQKMVEDSIKNDLDETEIGLINDENERLTPMHGISFMEVMWNPDFKHHLYRGEIEIKGRHPKCIIPQPGVYNLQKMDYFFIVSTVTKNYVKKRYDVEVESEGEEYPDFNGIGDDVSSNTDDKLTEIVAWYKDEDGDICKYVWVNDKILEDMPKYFYRRVDGEIQNTETIQFDIKKYDGTIIPGGTEVPYFVPQKYPVVARINVPKSFKFSGESDIDIIRDQQDAIKKVVSVMEEKIIRGGAIIKALEDHNVKLTSALYQVIKGNQLQLNALGVETLEADISKDMEFTQYMYKSAQSTLGITDSFQGKQDTTAKSGIAKQAQIQQAAGRLQSKLANKYSAFKELFEIIFEFKLAFYDELRPYVYKDENGQDQYGGFDKYQFLEQDKAEEWYYNTDFIITADAGSGISRDKNYLLQQAKEDYQSHAIDAKQYYTIKKALGFPMAGEILSQIEEKEQQAMQQAAMMQQQTQPMNNGGMM